MKNRCLIFYLHLLTFHALAQVPQPKSVTIDPNSNEIQDVKGNLKVSGISESNTVRANGLATGNPYIAMPVYANGQGYLVTGYKIGYFSIPPVALRLNYDINTEGQSYSLGPDFALYDGGYLGFVQPSTYRVLLAPLYFPHKSKLSSLQLTFSSNTDVQRALNGLIIQTSINSSSGATNVFSFTTSSSINGSLVIFEVPINLIEIDNQNYTYSLQLSSSSNDWTLVSIKGASIEYRDF